MDNRYLQIDQRTQELNERLAAQPELAREFNSKLDMSLIYHENALEGVVYSSAELMAALDPLALPPDASLVSTFTEIRNHKAAIDFVRAEASNKKSKPCVALLKKLYEIFGTGIEGREKAVYRKEMPLHRTYFHEIAQPTKIPSLLEKVFERTADPDFRENHPIAQAAQLQWELMQVFPFTDNSGRICRLMSQQLLLRHGYLPVVIHAVDRQRYYESLRLPVASLQLLLVDAMENSIENAMKLVPRPAPRPAPAAEPRPRRSRRAG
jgi:Fic family protein